jgi:hypothetical protein
VCELLFDIPIQFLCLSVIQDGHDQRAQSTIEPYEEEFEDTKEVIRIRESKKDTQRSTINDYTYK